MSLRKIILTAALVATPLLGCQRNGRNDTVQTPILNGTPAQGTTTTGTESTTAPNNPSTGMVATTGSAQADTSATATDSASDQTTDAANSSDVRAPANTSGTATAAPATDQQKIVLHFQPGSSTIDTADQSRLQSFVKSLGATPGQIFVAAWSDKNYSVSTTDNQRLSRADVAIAESRLNNIKKAIGTGVNITGYNMAQDSNWLARTLRTRDEDLQSVFAKQDPSAPMREDFDYLKSEGGASKAVVIVKAGSATM